MPVLEKEIEAAVVKWAEKRGWIALKLNNPWSKGWPDRLFISPRGVHIYIEFKRPGGRLGTLQKNRIGRLERNECLVFVKYDKESAVETLETLG